MSKKRKVPFSEVAKLGYYKVSKGLCNGVRGFYYWVDTLTTVERTNLEKYNNTKILKGGCEYAPEIKKVAIFMGNKCF